MGTVDLDKTNSHGDTSPASLNYIGGIMARPVGHVTDLIRDLERWIKARDNKGLDSKPLKTSVIYLEEYRALIYQHGELMKTIQ